MQIAYTVIYNNLLKFIEHNGMKPDNILTKTELDKNINMNGVAIITSQDICVMLANSSRIGKSYNDSQKTIIKKFVNKPKILIVSNLDYTTQNYNKVSNVITSNNHIMLRKYTMFLYNVPAHISYIPLKVILPDKYENELTFSNINKSSFARLTDTDASVTWECGKVGDIVEISRISDVGICTTSYKLIVSGFS